MRQRVATAPGDGDPDPGAGAGTTVMGGDHGAEALSRRIIELEKQVAGIPACQAHARLVEEERDILRAKLALEEHSTDGPLAQRVIELEAQVAGIPACQAHARQVVAGHDAIIERLVS